MTSSPGSRSHDRVLPELDLLSHVHRQPDLADENQILGITIDLSNQPRNYQMKKTLLALLAVIGVSANSATLSAETSTGWYVGANLGFSRTTLDREPREGLIEDDKSDLSWSLRAGYRFHQNWAVEAGYTDLGESRYHFPDEPQGTLKFKTLHLSAIGILPLTERLSVFGKLGVAYLQSDDSGVDRSSDTVPHAGLGLSYALTKTIDLRTDYDYFGRAQLGEGSISAKTTSQVLSVGVDYRF